MADSHETINCNHFVLHTRALGNFECSISGTSQSPAEARHQYPGYAAFS